MRKHNFITDKYQKFGFRKYLGIGLCSVVLGSFFIVSGQSQQVQADTVGDNTQTSTIVTTNDNKVEVDEPSQVVEKNAPPASTVQETTTTENSDTQQTQNNTVETTDEKSVNTQETPTQQVQSNDNATKTENVSQQPSTQKVTETEQNSDTQKVQASDDVSKSAEPAEKTETTPSPAKDDTVTLDVKNIRATDTKGLTESKVQVATRDNGGYDQATWGTLDITKWTGSQNGENYELTGYTGDLAHIIIPNEADFAKAGQIVSPIGISSTLTHSWFTGRDRPVSIAISKTEGKTVKALGNDWSFGFSGNSWPVHDYYHINPSSLTYFDGNNLDVSDVTKFDHIFADNKLSDTSGVSDWKFGNHEIYARGMFRSNQITDLTGLKEWDTSHFTNISYMFSGNNLTDLTPLAKWNVSHVTTMDNTFSFNKNLTTLHGLEKWKTDALTNLDETFSGGNGNSPNAISNLNDISALSSWNVSHVKTMAGTFLNNNIKDLSPLVKWKVGNVTRFTSTFMNNKIEDLGPLANWDTHSSTSMTQMFFNNNIKSLKPLSSWTTNNVIYMIEVFEGNQLTNLSGLENWNTSKVTTMRGMFESNQLTDVTALKNWDTSKVQDIGSMLFNNLLDTADLTNWNLDNVKAAGNFINAPGKLVVVVKSKYVNLMNGKSETYLYSPYLEDVVKAAQPNAVTIGKNDEFRTPTVYGAINNDSARQAIRAVVDGIVDQYKKDNPTKIVIPDKDLDTLTLIQLANAHFNIGYSNYYKFVDDNDNGKQVGENHNFQGTTDETVDLTIKIPENYELAPGQAEPPTSYTFIDGENTPIIIHLVHQTKDVSGDKNVDAHRTVGRDIFETSPLDGTVKKIHQEVKFDRTAIKDLVTGVITFGDWTPSTTMLGDPAYVATVYDGFTASQSTVSPIEVNSDSKPVDIYITYTADTQTNYYKFVDDDDNGKQVGENHDFDGKTDQTVDLNIMVPVNYKLAAGQEVPTSYKFKAKDNLPIIIHLVHDTRDVTDDRNVDSHRTVDRTISEHNPHTGEVTKIYQSVDFNRTATLDLVTNVITFSKWTPKNGVLDSYIATIYEGYTANIPHVDELKVDVNSKPDDIDIFYTADGQTNYYKFVDDDNNGKQVGNIYNFEGETGQKVDLDIEIPANYKLATGQTVPTSYTFKAKDNLPIIIHLVHQTQAVKEDKAITRTITTIKPDGTTSKQVQTVTFTRNGVKDLVTNNIKYGDWDAKTKTFPAEDVQQIDGYYSYVDGIETKVVNSQEVTPSDKDIQVTVTYKAHDNGHNTPDVPPDPETPPKKDDPNPTEDKHPTPPDEKPDPEPDDDIPKEPTKKDKTKKTKKNKNTNKPKPVKDSSQNGPVKAEHGTPQNIGSAPVKGTSLISNSTTDGQMTECGTTTDKKHATLPETGETNHLAIAALGLALAGLSLLGFKKKKRT